MASQKVSDDVTLPVQEVNLDNEVEEISTGSDSDYSKYAVTLISCLTMSTDLVFQQLRKIFHSTHMQFIRLTLGYDKQWISWFLSSKGNEYFCEVEEDYILDRFNLTGLNTEVQNYAQALDLITDNLGMLLFDIVQDGFEN